MSITSRVFNVPSDGTEGEKCKELENFFTMKFNVKPDFFVRAPGRVNIIGEHIDYCGYAVFPMAIRQSVLVAVAKREDSQLCLVNSDSKYEKFECDVNSFVIGDIKHSWYKYILCGIKGLAEEQGMAGLLKGMSLAVKGDIPPSVGLSSSSALVCAAALLAAHANDVSLSLRDLAELCARSERFIGTQGGGMDQAASLLSNAGSAQIIEFNPLKCTPVTLPEGANFVVANSLVEINKAAGSQYNTRVVECRLACVMLAKKSNVELKGKWSLGELQSTLGKSFSGMVSLVKEFLHPEPYSKTELQQLLGVTSAYLDMEILSENTLHLTEFNLYKRALHVFTESSRVWEFKQLCDDWTSKKKEVENQTKVLHQLGRIMEESHASAQFLYECSHPQMDKIVALSKDIAYGARLTGAGWGGCVIALVDEGKVEEYKEMLKKEYYGAENIKVDDWASVLFSSEPSAGACLYENDVAKNGH